MSDLILHNGKIATLDPAHPDASALMISDGRVTVIGSDAAVLARRHGATAIDLQGRRAIPGLNDSHIHPIRGGLNFNMELRWDGVRSLSDAMNMLKRQVAITPPPQWVRVVGGFSEHQILRPDRRGARWSAF